MNKESPILYCIEATPRNIQHLHSEVMLGESNPLYIVFNSRSGRVFTTSFTSDNIIKENRDYYTIVLIDRAHPEIFALIVKATRDGDKIVHIPGTKDDKGLLEKVTKTATKWEYTICCFPFAPYNPTKAVYTSNTPPSKLSIFTPLEVVQEYSLIIPRRYQENTKELITNKSLNNKNNENQLFRKKASVIRGDQPEGNSVSCRKNKAIITVGHLSYQRILGR